MTTVPAPGSRGRRPVARSVAVGAGSIGSPAALLYTGHTTAAAVLGIAEAALVVVFIAVLCYMVFFGTEEQCERSFRLLRWLRNEPEPESPPETTTPPPASSTP